MDFLTIPGSAVNKEDLIPQVPALTRYRKESGIKSFVKKEVTDFKLIDVRSSSQINDLSVPKLCVRLNTLYVSFFLFLYFLGSGLQIIADPETI